MPIQEIRTALLLRVLLLAVPSHSQRCPQLYADIDLDGTCDCRKADQFYDESVAICRDFLCPVFATKLGGECYYFGPAKRWEDAKAECEVLDSHLIAVGNRREKEAIQKYLQKEHPDAGNWWADFKYVPHRPWRWLSDDSKVDNVLNWQMDIMRSRQSAACGSIAISPELQLLTTRCDADHKFICEIKQVTTDVQCPDHARDRNGDGTCDCLESAMLFNPELGVCAPFSCPKAAVKLDNGCYKFGSEQRLTWKAAHQACKAMGAQFLSVTDLHVKGTIAKHLRSTYPGEFFWWLGLQRRGDAHGVWTWTALDAPLSELAITWEIAMTKNREGAACGGLVTASGKNDLAITTKICNMRMPYICQFEPEYVTPTVELHRSLKNGSIGPADMKYPTPEEIDVASNPVAHAKILEGVQEESLWTMAAFLTGATLVVMVAGLLLASGMQDRSPVQKHTAPRFKREPLEETAVSNKG